MKEGDTDESDIDTSETGGDEAGGRSSKTQHFALRPMEVLVRRRAIPKTQTTSLEGTKIVLFQNVDAN